MIFGMGNIDKKETKKLKIEMDCPNGKLEDGPQKLKFDTIAIERECLVE
jgi:hypothetical protein